MNIRSRFFLVTTLLLTAAMPVAAALPGMKVVKLGSRGYTDYGNRRFGHAVALSDKYAVVSERGYDPMSPKAGAVHVFNAATGAFIRTIRPNDSALDDGFGFSLALCGNRLLVGADKQLNSPGAAYLFEVSTGKQLAKYTGAYLGCRFGYAVGLSEKLAVVSAPEQSNQRGILRIIPLDGVGATEDFQDPSGNSQEKLGQAIYVHGDRIAATTLNGRVIFLNRTAPAGFTALSGAVYEGAGINLAGTGHYLFAGAPDGDGTYTDCGAVGRLSFSNPSTGMVFADPKPGTGRHLGRLIAVEGKLLAASVDVSSTRAIVLHNLTESLPLMMIEMQDLGTAALPNAMAMSGGRLLIGADGEDYQDTESGAAYLVQPLPLPAPFFTVASRGDTAPGYAGVKFNSIGDSAIAFNDVTVMRTTLSGPSSNGGKDVGLYSEKGHQGYFDSVVKTREMGMAGAFASIGSPITNDLSYCLFPVTFSGPGLTSANNRSLMSDDGTGVFHMLALGDPMHNAASSNISAFRQVAQSNGGMRFALRLDARIGPGNVAASNDTAVCIYDHAGAAQEQVREGAILIPGIFLGQMAPRAAFDGDAYFLSCALNGNAINSTNNIVVIQKQVGVALKVLARKGQPAPGTSADYNVFLGESGDSVRPFLRATVAGAGINATSDETLFLGNGVGPLAIAREGQPIPGQGGVAWARFLHSWPIGNRVLVRAIIKGTGVTSASNEALYLYQEDGSWVCLLRKGDVVPGAFGARVAALQKVEVSSRSAYYGVLCSLSGATATNNQAFLRGDASATFPDMANAPRRPVMLLRKGQTIVNGYAGTTRLTSLAFANSSTLDATGVGRKGLGSVVSQVGVTLLRASFSDGSSRLIRVP